MTTVQYYDLCYVPVGTVRNFAKIYSAKFRNVNNEFRDNLNFCYTNIQMFVSKISFYLREFPCFKNNYLEDYFYLNLQYRSSLSRYRYLVYDIWIQMCTEIFCWVAWPEVESGSVLNKGGSTTLVCGAMIFNQLDLLHFVQSTRCRTYKRLYRLAKYGTVLTGTNVPTVSSLGLVLIYTRWYSNSTGRNQCT